MRHAFILHFLHSISPSLSFFFIFVSWGVKKSSTESNVCCFTSLKTFVLFLSLSLFVFSFLWFFFVKPLTKAPFDVLRKWAMDDHYQVTIIVRSSSVMQFTLSVIPLPNFSLTLIKWKDSLLSISHIDYSSPGLSIFYYFSPFLFSPSRPPLCLSL